MKTILLLFLSGFCYAQTENELQFLTNQTGTRDYWPAYSEDGKAIIFSRLVQGEKWKLFQVPVAGGESTVFWEGEVGATRANTSRSGRIAFTGIEPKTNATLWITDRDGKESRKIGLHNHTGTPSYPSWYPDEKRLVMVDYQRDQGGNLILVDLPAGKAVTITNPSEIRCGMPSISPNGDDIVFAGQKPGGGDQYDQTKNAIWLLKKDKSLHRLSPGQGRAPTWSPDGKWVAYESTEGSPDGRYAIFIVSADGKQNRRVCSYEWDANHPVWSSDGKTLVVSARNPGSGAETRIALLRIPAY